MWALRLPPIAYFVVAPLIALFAVVLYFQDRDDEADKAFARTHRPPAETRIESFDRQRHLGRADEVLIVGQADVDAIVEVTEKTGETVTDTWTVVPLYATNATAKEDAARAAIIHKGGLTERQLIDMVVGEGAFGPLMRVDGVLAEEGEAAKVLGEGVGGRFRTSEAAIAVDPFVAGRAAGLAASDDGRTAAAVIIFVAALVGGYGFLRRRWNLRAAPRGG